jgi:spore coat polysaccharide biosynthesis protein SpsF (cytidylyltransferase family)
LSAKVVIAIQARSGSTRLPRKAFELIGNKMMLDHVIYSAKSAAKYINHHSAKSGIEADVVVVTPVGDQIAEAFRSRCPILTGPEKDVLERYIIATRELGADYVVRLTGDCPLIPDFLIAKLIKLAAANGYDYLSNVDEETRTAMDGHDCEVISRRLMDHLYEHAKDAYDREHVTTMARRDPPPWARLGCVINYQDQSDLKLSVDTPEDLQRVRDHYQKRDMKLFYAERKFGRQSVHRL